MIREMIVLKANIAYPAISILIVLFTLYCFIYTLIGEMGVPKEVFELSVEDREMKNVTSCPDLFER